MTSHPFRTTTTRRATMGAFLMAVLVAACSGTGTPAPGTSREPVATSGGPAAASATSPAGGSVATAAASAPDAVGSLRVTAGPDLCTLLSPADFTAAGVAGAGPPSKNSSDPTGFYCVYAGKSSATGGIEFDIFVWDMPPTDDDMTVPGVYPEVTADVPGADRARYQADPPLIGVRSGNLVFNIGFPTSPTAQASAIALAKLVLSRAAALPH
jgi:hypothetical protein